MKKDKNGIERNEKVCWKISKKRKKKQKTNSEMEWLKWDARRKNDNIIFVYRLLKSCSFVIQRILNWHKQNRAQQAHQSLTSQKCQTPKLYQMKVFCFVFLFKFIIFAYFSLFFLNIVNLFLRFRLRPQSTFCRFFSML